MMGNSFDSVFKNIEMPDRLAKVFGETRVKGVTALKEARKLRIELVSDTFIESSDVSLLRNALERRFSDAGEIEVSLIYDLPRNDDAGFLDVCKRDFCDRLKEKRPIMGEILFSCEWLLETGHLTVKLPADSSFLMVQSGTDKLIAGYFKDCHGISVDVSFEQCGGLTGVSAPAQSYAPDKPFPAREAAGERSVAGASGVPAKPVSTVKKNPVSFKEPKKSGSLLGRAIKGAAVSVSASKTAGERVIIEGAALSVEIREIKGDRLLVKLDVTDNTDSTTVVFFAKSDRRGELSEGLKKGGRYRIEGDVQYDKYSREINIAAKGIEKLAALPEKTDDATEKRIELHLHTQMSQMDAMASAKALIERAAKWGHEAIAITDHGVVQAFPEAMDSAKKYGIRVLYGMEGYLVDDIGSIVRHPQNQALDGVFVVFDVETTGLKKEKDALTEIGAVKIVNGTVAETFSMFVDPGRPVPYEITKLTGITDKMLKGAPKPGEAVKSFLEFAGDAVLAAHNADFDMGFITRAAETEGLLITNTILDTLELSRTLFPELKRHKLESVAEHLKIDMGHAHRALDDANTTAQILIKSFSILKDDGAENVSDINVFASENINLKKAKSYHIVIIARNQTGLKNLYELVSLSSINYFYKKPRILKSLLHKHREGLLIGSACGSGELFSAFVAGSPIEQIREIAAFYDYFEVQPLGNNQFLIDGGMLASKEALIELNKRIIALGEETAKPVVATGDVHFLDAEDEIYRRIIMKGEGYKDAEHQPPLYFHTTREMLDEFYYLDDETAKKIVIDNPHVIAGMVDDIKPIPSGTFPPEIEGAEETLRQTVMENACSVYGSPLPAVVSGRLDKELNSIISNGFSVMYIIARKLVQNSEQNGYLVGSRGSVGSSLAATFAGITEVNPLPPHYVCPECKYSDFDSEEVKGFAGKSGCDMPDKTCPQCGTKLKKDGHDIPFETFLGFNGEKEPDIDLNFSGEYQQSAHAYCEELFGSGNVFKAGTINTLAEKNAYGYVKKYFEEKEVVKHNAEINRLVAGLTGIKKTTGQHPGGLMVVPRSQDIHNFTPVQRPANDTSSTVTTTHFDYHSISGRLLKLDLLGHDDPTVLKMLYDLTGVDPKSIPLDDEDTLSLFTSPEKLGVTPRQIGCETGTLGIPEFGTKFVRQMLMDTTPQSFAELIRISGLSHGTNVWLNNGQDYIKQGKAKLENIISTRDDIMVYLIIQGIEKTKAFDIMETVRKKGKNVSEEQAELMRSSGVPDWYIESCNKIEYMFPKAHAAAYVMMAFRIAWFKVKYPKEFYASYFTVRADEFDYTVMCRGEETLRHAIRELDEKGNDMTAKEKGKLTIMEVVLEMYARGVSFIPLDLYKSDARRFEVLEEGILPPLNSIPGLGITAAESVAEARRDGEFLSIEDLLMRTSLSKTVSGLLKECGVLEGLPDTSQLTLL